MSEFHSDAMRSTAGFVDDLSEKETREIRQGTCQVYLTHLIPSERPAPCVQNGSWNVDRVPKELRLVAGRIRTFRHGLYNFGNSQYYTRVKYMYAQQTVEYAD